MNILIGIMTISLVMMMVIGVYYHINPPNTSSGDTNKKEKFLKNSVGINLIVFVCAQAGLLLFAYNDVMAAAPAVNAASAAASEFSIGKGLAFIGIGLPTGMATIAAGFAVAPIGASSLAAISEKPEIFGRSLIYLGLAEGIAIYGLVATILLLNKI
jgi:V/A-type H+-transporting ATPase subunit K